jgi:hypothetical protein
LPFWPALALIVGTVLVVGVLSKWLSSVELKLTDKFSEITSNPRWFTSWVLVFILWAAVHIGLRRAHVTWYNDDLDFIIVTALFSAIPFWVENSLKHSQAKFQALLLRQVDTIAELTVAIRHAVDQGEGRDVEFAAENEMVIALIHKLLDAMETEVLPDGRQVEVVNGTSPINHDTPNSHQE